MIYLSNSRIKRVTANQLKRYLRTVLTQNQRFLSAAITRFIRKQSRLLLVAASLWVGLSSCSSPSDDVTPASTGESISYKVDGKPYSDNTVVFLGDADYFSLFSSIATSSSFNSPGYLLQLDVAKPKAGTFTAQSGELTGSITYLKSLSDFLGYDISTKTGGAITFTNYNSNGFAEGTFSFVGKTDKGLIVNVTEGKFRVALK